MKAGVVLKDVYQCAVEYVQEKRPALSEFMPKNIGFGTGLDFKDNSLTLSAKSEKVLKENMVFNLSLGFNGMTDPVNKAKTYALLLADTVKVGKEMSVLLTEGTKKAADVVLYEDAEEVSPDDALDEPPPTDKKASQDDVSEIEEVPKKTAKAAPKPAKESARTSKSAPSPKGKVVANKTLRAKTRGAGKEMDETQATKYKEHQKTLHETIQKRGTTKYRKSSDGKAGGKAQEFRKFESYKREDQLPDLSSSSSKRVSR